MNITIIIILILINKNVIGYKLNNNLNIKLYNQKNNYYYKNKSISINYNYSKTNLNNNNKILKINNSLLIDNKFNKFNPILSIDLGTKFVGFSFNYLNSFDLFKNIKFINYRQLTVSILGLIKEIIKKYNLIIDNENKFIILLGIPYIPINNIDNKNGIKFNGDNNGDKINLFQILFALDYSQYLSYFINKFFNKSLNNNNEKEIKNKILISTYCLYCSILHNYNNININKLEILDNVSTDEIDKNNYKCLLNKNKNCINTFNINNNLNFLLLGIYEYYSTYQVSSFINNINNNKSLISKDNLSTLNIYYNFINNNNNMDNSLKNFMLLPNKNNIFSTKNKSDNILLYNNLKKYLL